MMPALRSIASQQDNPTERTMQKANQLLDYAVTHPDAIITYRASDMVIDGHSDASYFFVSSSRSRAGVHFYMTEESETPLNNGAVMTISQIIKAVIFLAAETELCTLFVNCRESIPARIFQE